MAAKGQPKTGGRQKGTPNKLTADLKDMILGALDDAGGRHYLARQAVENPGPFMVLVGKVLPTTLAGDKQNPIAYQNIDAPAKETRDEWLARQRGTSTAAARNNPGDVVR